jgi:hypothetical protein
MKVEYFFMYFLAICTFFFENSLCPFLHWDINSLGLFWVPCRFWMLVPYWMSNWQRFSPILWAVSWVCWLFLLLCRSSLVLRSPVCLFFLLDTEPFDIDLGSISLYLSVPVYFLLLPEVVSKFQALC